MGKRRRAERSREAGGHASCVHAQAAGAAAGGTADGWRPRAVAARQHTLKFMSTNEYPALQALQRPSLQVEQPASFCAAVQSCTHCGTARVGGNRRRLEGRGGRRAIDDSSTSGACQRAGSRLGSTQAAGQPSPAQPSPDHYTAQHGSRLHSPAGARPCRRRTWRRPAGRTARALSQRPRRTPRAQRTAAAAGSTCRTAGRRGWLGGWVDGWVGSRGAMAVGRMRVRMRAPRRVGWTSHGAGRPRAPAARGRELTHWLESVISGSV